MLNFVMPQALTLAPDALIRRVDRVLFAQLDDEFLALDGQQSRVYSLNESASCVWTALESPTVVRNLCEALRSEYDVDDATCEREVIALLSALHAAGLVEIVDSPS